MSTELETGRIPLDVSTTIKIASGESAKATILLVDDDTAVRTCLRHGLQLSGFHVQDAPGVKPALSILQSTHFDWLVTDIVMPDQDGLELLQAVRDKYPKTRIIAMSGGGLGSATDYLKVARFLGAKYIISKPFMYSELVALMDSD